MDKIRQVRKELDEGSMISLVEKTRAIRGVRWKFSVSPGIAQSDVEHIVRDAIADRICAATNVPKGIVAPYIGEQLRKVRGFYHVSCPLELEYPDDVPAETIVRRYGFSDASALIDIGRTLVKVEHRRMEHPACGRYDALLFPGEDYRKQLEQAVRKGDPLGQQVLLFKDIYLRIRSK